MNAPMDQAGAAATDFWRSQLQGALPLLGFPTDHHRPARLPAEGAAVEVPVPAALAARLHALCGLHSLGVDELFLAAYQVFLSRYAGQEDIVVGTALPGSAEPLPLRQRVDPQEPWLALAERNRLLRAALAAHRDQPWTAAMDALAIDAAASHAPVFQHALSLQPLPGGVPAIGPFDTRLVVLGGAEGLAVTIHYNTCLFESRSASRWALNFGTLLESICADPACTVGALGLLHARELAFMAESLDKTGVPFRARFPSVHAGFEQQVARTPQAVAVRCGAQAWSYAELDGRANAVAGHLRGLGLGAGDLVGICTSRGNDMIAAVIGVLKLGAGYVSMDIKYPALRLQSIASEAGLRFVVCDQRGSGLLGDGVQEVLLSDVPATLASFAGPPADLESISHVIFTSGSTGKPKGVMARHRNVLAFLEWIWATYTPEELRVTLCCSSLCFDLTVFEIWGPLTTGGQVVVVDDAAALVHSPQPGLTLVNTVPTALRLLLQEQALPSSVRTVNVCGERLDAQLVADLFKDHPGVVFHNTYGPTEDTAYSTFFMMTGPYDGDPPIGVPLVHEFGRVVDARGALVPVGAVGELWVGGAGVARGYVNNPEQTAERFVASTNYAGEPAMAYRTGDFVRLRNDGQLHFVGRRDDQVKLRGFRIELGDVVNALQQIPGVTNARVLVQRHKTGDVLVAYVSHAEMTPGEHQHPRLSQFVEDEARARLPGYMVPGYFVLFDKLPLNENGKVDRHALNAVPYDTAHAQAPAPALGDDERVVAAIWKAILLVDHVAPDDDFFLMGGNSLLGVLMVSRVNKHFGTTLSAQAVFEDRTVRLLARRVRRDVVEDTVPLVPVDAAQGVRPTYQQLAMLMDPLKTSFNLGSVLRIEGPLDAQALRRALQALTLRHDALRARFTIDGMDVRMHIVDAWPDLLREVELPPGEPATTEQRVAAELQREWCQPFDLQRGPPLRAMLLRVAPQHHVLVLSIHHVVTDEWSRNIVKHDLGALYALEVGSAAQAPAPLPIRYVDFADWLGRMHETGDYRRQLMYWSQELAGLAGAAPFPDGCGDPAAGGASRYVDVAPPAGIEQLLPRLAQRHGTTPYVVFMTALQLALAAFSGVEQQVVWSPVSRRVRPELEQVMGLFTNLTAVSATASRDLTLSDHLRRIDDKVSQARASSDVSVLTAAMHDPRLMPALPMIGLNFMDLPNEDPWTFPGAKVVPLDMRVEDDSELCALLLTVHFGSQGMRIVLDHKPRVFGAASVQVITETLWSMLERLDRSPGTRIAELLPPARPTAPAAVASHA